MSFDTALQSLKAAADPTRLRLLALLAGGEATVSELQEILAQSQPRVSRHLRLLGEARGAIAAGDFAALRERVVRSAQGNAG